MKQGHQPLLTNRQRDGVTDYGGLLIYNSDARAVCNKDMRSIVILMHPAAIESVTIRSFHWTLLGSTGFSRIATASLFQAWSHGEEEGGG
jgi:hypothetical protein